MYREISEELLDFLQKSPTAFHAVENIKEELKGHMWEFRLMVDFYLKKN